MRNSQPCARPRSERGVSSSSTVRFECVYEIEGGRGRSLHHYCKGRERGWAQTCPAARVFIAPISMVACFSSCFIKFVHQRDSGGTAAPADPAHGRQNIANLPPPGVAGIPRKLIHLRGVHAPSSNGAGLTVGRDGWHEVVTG